MVPATSLEAYNKIKESGVISEKRFDVYEYIHLHPDCTIKDANDYRQWRWTEEGNPGAAPQSTWGTRFSELERMGLIVITGKTNKHGNYMQTYRTTGRTDPLPMPKIAFKNKYETLLQVCLEFIDDPNFDVYHRVSIENALEKIGYTKTDGSE